MKYQPKNVMILGGTGFLGYAAAQLFLSRGQAVSAIALEDELPTLDWVDPRIRLVCADLFCADGETLKTLFAGCDTLVYALGPDDRVLPNAPAYDFFKSRLVDACARILAAAREVGVRRAVVMSSYFCRFDRAQKGRLSRFHPYIRARIEQEKAAVETGQDGVFDVMLLELPYIFGAPIGRKPIWKDAFLSHFDGMSRVFFPRGGGTAAVDVSGVAQAVYAAAVNGVHGRCYQVGKENLLFSALVPMMLKYAGDSRRYVSVPAFLCAPFAKKIGKAQRQQGKESGLNLSRLMTQIQNRKFYLDPQALYQSLGYEELGFDGGRDVETGVAESIAALD